MFRVNFHSDGCSETRAVLSDRSCVASLDICHLIVRCRSILSCHATATEQAKVAVSLISDAVYYECVMQGEETSGDTNNVSNQLKFIGEIHFTVFLH